jgi:hypothetical protein
MSLQPIVSFFSSSLKGRKPFPRDFLDSQLPLSQSDFAVPIQSFWTYHHYFQAIQKVLAKDSYTLLLEATRRQLALSLGSKDVQRIFIYSEKHGNWYHPAKIEVITSQGCARFVINVALTERGRAVMSQEIRALKYLAVHFTYPWLPTIYFCNESVTVPSIGNETQVLSLSLFLADWFEGFHEFHLSIDPVDGLIKMILWDGSPKPNYLSRRQAGNVYFEISKILTLYYNPRTYQQIFPWHHGAGDFVIKLDGERIDVRLVTVRQYGPLADPEEMSVEEALVFFFLNLSLRMRLDRLDGVGEIAWAGEGCLGLTWEGFQEALRIKEKQGSLTPGFRRAFLKDLSRFSEETLTDRFQDLLASYTPEAPDLSVIKKNIIPHIKQVQATVQSLGR